MSVLDQTPAVPTLDLRTAISRNALYSFDKPWSSLTIDEQLMAVGQAIRQRTVDLALATEQRYQQAGAKRAYYLSLECLIGRSLGNNLVNLGLLEECRRAVQQLGGNLDELIHAEPDAALGNGGLGRLAACLLDSMATLGMPGFGYGLNYNYGLFKQEIHDGYQRERPDDWLRHGTPWEVGLINEAIEVHLYGHVENDPYAREFRPMWVDTRVVLGVPHDLPIVGYGGKTVNMLRLFGSRASQNFNMEAFDEGKYIEAVQQKAMVETITQVLYPNDSVPRGPELRLVQEYFLVACALRDILRRQGGDIRQFADRAALQLNDTHPSLAVAELMRILVDEHRVEWEEAWSITTRALAFTNHTLMPEALERWPVALFEKVLPRHLQIVYEINRRFLDQVAAAYPGDDARKRRMSLIEEGLEKKVRMAYLAIVGSHSVNGVAKVHSELVKTQLVPDFYEMMPQKFNNKTNGVTPRRWLLLCNPGLAQLLDQAVGNDRWVSDLSELRALEKLADDAGFQERFRAVKRANKARLAEAVREATGVQVDPDAVVDAQVKRIHEYKRQLLNLLHVVHEYLRIVEDGQRPDPPRTYLFAGKAAPGYRAAKEIIHLINVVGSVINRDPQCHGLIKCVFVPDYRVTLAETIIPAAQLSEQISTAGTEASGTSNMKFAMNGALTIGTLDGANIEIQEEVGKENLFIFGNTVQQIQELHQQGVQPRTFYDQSPVVRRVLDAFRSDRLSLGNPGQHAWVVQKLVDNWDPYFHLADLEAYLAAHDQAAAIYRNPREWTRRAILNVARMGKFSSDRTVREYAQEIWNIRPVV